MSLMERVKALVADDDDPYRISLRMLLAQKNYQVFEAVNGLEAWQIYQREDIQLVVTDWMMAGLEGVQLAEKIRQVDRPYYTYIMIMTARSSRDDVVDGLLSGADDYLVKPFSPKELNARLGIAERILSYEHRLRSYADQLYQLANYDALTGLLNRRALYEQANEDLSRARREGSSLSLIMVDIDHFKTINDRFGHAAGDRALCYAAHKILSARRPYDLIGRWGGEEFLICLPGGGLKDGLRVAERVRHQLASSQLQLEAGSAISLTASLGVASADDFPNAGFEKLVQYADDALYRAKENGRNRVESATPGT